MRRQPANIPASIRDRLLARAREKGEDFQLVLQRYAAERFLFRLGESEFRDQFVLKGAMLFSLWGGSMYRATRDLDFTGFGPDDTGWLMETIRTICIIPCPSDGIEFMPDSIQAEPIRDESEYHGFCVRFQARLGVARIPLQVDVGFGNAIVPGAEDTDYPVLLNGLKPNIRAYPREAVVAEKVHTIVVYGTINSRMKDFYDLYVLADRFAFDGNTLSQAIEATFNRRSTPMPDALPVGLSPAFYADAVRAGQWRGYLQRNSLSSAPLDFDRVGETLRAFLGPVLWSALGDNAFKGSWQPGGPWR